MYKEHPDDFHDVAILCEKKKLSKNTIELVRKHLIPYQSDIYKPTVIVWKWRNKVKTVERVVRFDEEEQEFYVLYGRKKHWVQPIRTPLNQHDTALNEWTIY